MIQDAIHWLSGFSWEQYLLTFSGMLLLDGPRYLFMNILIVFWEFFASLKKQPRQPAYLPNVTILIPGLNESATIVQCLESLYGSYPFLQKERDEIELSMVADCHVQRSGAAVADLCTIDGFNKYFALRPVPSYRQRDAGTIFLIPTLSGICLS